jgi:GNAT superfamily N-acetyltransferase
MGEFNIKRLDCHDFGLIVKLRIDFVKDLRPGLNAVQLQNLHSKTEHWVREHLDKDLLVGYCGFLNEIPVCCASLLCYELPPLPEFLSRKIGHVLNFFTYKDYRQKGFGSRLMAFIKEDAAKLGIYRLALNATPMGEPLYRKAGFYEQEDTALILQVAT